MFNILSILFGLLVSPANAQTVTCATRPNGDASNACASTAFVANPANAKFPTFACPASQWVSSGVAGAPVCSQVGAGNISYNAGTTGAVTTTVGAKLQRIVDLDDYKSAATGADYCAALQAAITANPGATIRFPATVVQLGTASSTCNITWTTQATLSGAGWQETGVSGTVLYIPKGPSYDSVSTFSISGTDVRGSVIENMTIKQDEPAPGVGWSPNVYAPVFDVANTFGQFTIRNVTAYAVYDLVKSVNSGRLSLKGIRGQVFHNVVNVDQSYDSDRYEDIHIMPLFSGDTNVIAWTQANAQTIVFGRADTPFLDKIFTIYANALIATNTTASGVVSKIEAGSLVCDFCKYGLVITSNNVSADIASLTWQGQNVSGVTPITGGRAITVPAIAVRLNIANMIGERSDTAMIDVAGASNVVSIGNAYFNLANQNNSGATIVGTLGAATYVAFANPPVIEGSNGAQCGICVASVQALSVANQVNRPLGISSVTGSPVQYSALGTDTNIDVAIVPKGTGAVKLAPTQITVNSASFAAVKITDTNTSGRVWGYGPGVGTGTVTEFNFYDYTGSKLLSKLNTSGAYYSWGFVTLGTMSSLWTVDATGGGNIALATGTTSTLAAGSGQVTFTVNETGETCTFILGGTSVFLVGSSFSAGAVPGGTQKCSATNGGTSIGIDVSGGNYRLFNNSGATRTFTGVAGLRTRTTN